MLDSIVTNIVEKCMDKFLRKEYNYVWNPAFEDEPGTSVEFDNKRAIIICSEYDISIHVFDISQQVTLASITHYKWDALKDSADKDINPEILQPYMDKLIILDMMGVIP